MSSKRRRNINSGGGSSSNATADSSSMQDPSSQSEEIFECWLATDTERTLRSKCVPLGKNKPQYMLDGLVNCPKCGMGAFYQGGCNLAICRQSHDDDNGEWCYFCININCKKTCERNEYGGWEDKPKCDCGPNTRANRQKWHDEYDEFLQLKSSEESNFGAVGETDETTPPTSDHSSLQDDSSVGSDDSSYSLSAFDEEDETLEADSEDGEEFVASARKRRKSEYHPMKGVRAIAKSVVGEEPLVSSEAGQSDERRKIRVRTKGLSKEEEDYIRAQKRIRRLCKEKGCTNIVVKGGVCVKHGAKVKRCSHEGCTNGAVKGGVCWRHGAKHDAKICNEEGCASIVVKGGICVKHGAKKPTCRHIGCTNQVVQGGVCCRHGAKMKKCSHEGCTNQTQRGGVCIRHGAKVQRCSKVGSKS